MVAALAIYYLITFSCTIYLEDGLLYGKILPFSHKKGDFQFNSSILCDKTMPGSRKFCQRGSKFDNIFFFFFFKLMRDIGSKYHYKWAIIRPPAKCYLNGFRWQADDGPTLNAGLVAL